MWIILFKCGQFYLSVNNILLKLKNISFDIMQFVNDINPQFVNYRLSLFLLFLMQLHMFYLCTKSLRSYYQGINFIVQKFIIQAKPHSKQNYFHVFF
jgi:hypothetical protein